MSWNLKQKLEKIVSNEYGANILPPGVKQSFAFMYPNSYEVGMSNLGLHILYREINNRVDVVCERFFLPEKKVWAEYKKTKTQLLSLETQRPLNKFMAIGVMLSFELDYFNLLDMLSTSKIPLLSAQRTEYDSFVILGGPCMTFNPEPIADFADVVIIGEGEETIHKVLDIIYGVEKISRSEKLLKLSTVAGVYIPSLYSPNYNHDGTIASWQTEQGAKVVRQYVQDLRRIQATSAIITSETEFAQMFIVEVARGCGRHCRFCMAGYCFRRPRNYNLEQIIQAIENRLPQATKIGLMGAAVSDYPQIKELSEYLTEHNLKFTVASLRADSLNYDLVKKLAEGGQKTLTIAPEAGSERLRNLINKNISLENIMQSIEIATSAKMPNIKLYLMIGLPTENLEDIEEMLAMVVAIRKKMDELENIGELTLSINTFVPKPCTPFQWSMFAGKKEIDSKMKIIQEGLKKIRRVKVNFESYKESALQAILARGDRRLGKALFLANERGGKKDFLASLNEVKLATDFYLSRKFNYSEVLPWDNLDMGFDKEYLMQELDRAEQGQNTAACFEGCQRCGICK